MTKQNGFVLNIFFYNFFYEICSTFVKRALCCVFVQVQMLLNQWPQSGVDIFNVNVPLGVGLGGSTPNIVMTRVENDVDYRSLYQMYGPLFLS